MIESHDYQVSITGTGAKMGTLESTRAGLPPMEFASPPEFGGPAGTWSPEHLFVASVAGCLMTTFQAIAANSGIEVLEYTDEATGHLQRGDDRRYTIDRVTLRPTVVISADSNPEKTRRVLEKAEEACLIGRSIVSERILEPTVLQGSTSQVA